MIIGIFEAYNWYQLKRQQEELGSDEFWTKEMVKSSLALSSIATEIVAQYTKIVRGKDSIAFGISKVLSGILAMAVNFWVGMILILLDIVISYVKDDELESWLKKCALGEKYKHSSAYQNIEQRKTEFEKVLESMFGIT